MAYGHASAQNESSSLPHSKISRSRDGTPTEIGSKRFEERPLLAGLAIAPHFRHMPRSQPAQTAPLATFRIDVAPVHPEVDHHLEREARLLGLRGVASPRRSRYYLIQGSLD